MIRALSSANHFTSSRRSGAPSERPTLVVTLTDALRLVL
jgi:hypothetical protein